MELAKLVVTYGVIQCRSTLANIVEILNYAVGISSFFCSLSGCRRWS
jgi:hypothetical protein